MYRTALKAGLARGTLMGWCTLEPCPLARRRSFRLVVISAAYCAYLVTPLVHTLAEADGCPGCPGEGDGPAMWAPCEGPCSDPTHHHHHHEHDPDDCFLCQAYPPCSSPIDFPRSIEPTDEPQPVFTAPPNVFTHEAPPRPHLIRGPPKALLA